MSDREHLLNPSGWAILPDNSGKYCCLRCDKKHAFILTLDNLQGMTGEILVSLGNIFDGGTGEVISFKSVDDILSQGWIVD